MILHVDMDAFYAAVEQRDHSALRGRPVIVGGSAEGRGVVCAASYEARQFGIHSAMPTATALRLCPHVVLVSSRMRHYAHVSRQIREIFGRYTPLIEPLSLDEAFLDVTGSRALFGEPTEIGRRIKTEIREELNLVGSVGVAPNKFLAKLASDLQKPDGFVIVDPDQIQRFLDPLEVGRLWGVGRAAGKVFQRLGIRTIAHLRQLPKETLRQQFGRHGDQLWRLARGIDQRTVVPDREAKSISHETTFAADIQQRDVLDAWLLELAEQVGVRLRRLAIAGRTVHLKVRYTDFRTVTRSLKLTNPTNVTREIHQAVRELLHRRLPRNLPPIRLLGVGLSGLERDAPRQQLLFDEQAHRRQRRVDQAADAIRAKFGSAAIARGSRLLHQTRRQPPPKPA